MARITVEDCLERVENRFQLVLIATKRARQLADGAEPLVDRDNDKNTVVALREIAEGLVTAAILDEDDTPAAPLPFELPSLEQEQTVESLAALDGTDDKPQSETTAEAQTETEVESSTNGESKPVHATLNSPAPI